MILLLALILILTHVLENQGINTSEESKHHNYFFAVLVIMASVFIGALSTFLVKFAYLENKALTGFDYMIARAPTAIYIYFSQNFLYIIYLSWSLFIWIMNN